VGFVSDSTRVSTLNPWRRRWTTRRWVAARHSVEGRRLRRLGQDGAEQDAGAVGRTPRCRQSEWIGRQLPVVMEPVPYARAQTTLIANMAILIALA
jgi:hypothetical protein